MTEPRITGLDELVATFEAAAARIPGRALEITRRYGYLAQTAVRANMSGRTGVIFHPQGDEDAGPSGEIGPRAISGDLRRSVTVDVVVDASWVRATVGTNAPQARALELGYVGTDSLGRHRDQPPYPAWRPAFDALKDAYRRDIEALGTLDDPERI